MLFVFHKGDGKASRCQWSHWGSRHSEVGRKSAKVWHTLLFVVGCYPALSFTKRITHSQVSRFLKIFNIQMAIRAEELLGP